MIRLLLTALPLVLLGTFALAEDVVFDFEKESPKPRFETLSDLEKMDPVDRLTAGGALAARLVFPAVSERDAKKRWIALYPEKTDWSGRKWFSMEVANPTYEDVEVHGFLLDRDHGNSEEGMYFKLRLGPYEAKRAAWEIKLKDKPVDPSKIGSIRLYTENRKQTELIIDNVALWEDRQKPDGEPGEQLTKEMEQYRLAKLEELLKASEAAAREQKLPRPFAERIAKESKEVREKYAASRALTSDSFLAHYTKYARRDKNGEISEKEQKEIPKRCQARLEQERLRPLHHAHNVRRSVERYARMVQDLPAYQALGKPEQDVLIGFSTGMYKVMPRHVPMNIEYASAYSIELAGDERECFQVSVAPTRKDLRGVLVEVSDLTGPDGAVIPRSAIQCDLVGYTETYKRPGYGVDYVGWWPDPVLPIRTPVDVRLGDAQTWWVRVAAPRDQKAGDYRGVLTVKVIGRAPVTFDLNARVWDFNVPKHPPIPTAVTSLNDSIVEKWYGGTEAWMQKWRFHWADLLAQYYMTPDNIYRPSSPFPENPGSVDWELMEYLKRKGTLGSFCIGHFYSGSEKHCKTFQHNYDMAKKHGLEDYIYLYGFDEQPSWAYGSIEEACQNFEKLYPGVLQLTTTNDGQNGNNPAMPTLKGYCPLNAGYNPENAMRARRKLGKYVWWYTCIWPPHPWPNYFIEYEPHDMRAFTGLLHIGNKPDGFLYYHTTILGDNDGIVLSDGAYTNWDPAGMCDSHGDGRWLYITREGELIPSMVMENYRDGLEDTAYYMILQHKLRETLRQQSGYVKIERSGRTVTGYASGDGETWQKIGEQELEIDGPVYAGLYVTSHNEDELARVTFDNVRLTGRKGSDTGIKGFDVGTVGLAGSTTANGSEITLAGAGSDIWNRRDGFHFGYVQLNGDCAIQARVKNVHNYTHRWAKAGVMIRQSLESNAPFAMVAMIPGNDYGLQAILPRNAAFQSRSSISAEAKASGGLEFTPWMEAAHDALFDIKKYYWWLNGYTEDPVLLNEFRRKLATLIEQSPYEDEDPWAMHGYSAKGLKGITR